MPIAALNLSSAQAMGEDWAELLGVEMARKTVITVSVLERILFMY
jgi:hypothetical protein